MILDRELANVSFNLLSEKILADIEFFSWLFISINEVFQSVEPASVALECIIRVKVGR